MSQAIPTEFGGGDLDKDLDLDNIL